MSPSRDRLLAPLTAAALIAAQVGSNAARDALFLSFFPVGMLPYFIGGAALLAVPAAQASGRLLARFGPERVVPTLLAASAALFLTERSLLGTRPGLAAVLLYFHSSVLGGVAISAFWSLLNERFDPHTARPVMARVAAAAAFGGLLGGAGAERAGALASPAVLLLALAVLAGACVAGVGVLGRAMPQRARAHDPGGAVSAWASIRGVPLLRHLASVVVLAAMVAGFADYALKADAVAHFGRGEALVRFFGLFHGATSVAGFLLQATLGRLVLGRAGLAGSVASHPALVGTAGVFGFVVPPPWRSLFPRGLDVSLRASLFRAGYELLYTPLPAAAKRSAKSTIDVVGDSLGKSAAAAAILVLARLGPGWTFVAVNACLLTAALGELLVTRRLRAGYVRALEGGLVRHGDSLDEVAQRSLSDFTAIGSLGGLDRGSVLRAVRAAERKEAPAGDPVLGAITDLRSGDPARIRAALRLPPVDPLVVGALIPALERRETLRAVVSALEAYGPRAAGQLVDALLDPGTPETVRRRLPLVLKSCASPLARDGLVQALAGQESEIRLRCSRALLLLTDDHPELAVPAEAALAALERELAGRPHGEGETREHVFNLLTLALEREPARIVARALDGGDDYVRGTALEYLQTVLPPALFAALEPRVAGAAKRPSAARAASDVRADLLDAGATLTASRAELRRAAVPEDEAEG
jgi:hypothetical protein